MPKILENGQIRDMTADEIEVSNVHVKINQEASAAKSVEQIQLAADKQSAHDKLSALGLTDAEIEAIT